MDKQKQKEYVTLRLRLSKEKIESAEMLLNNAMHRDAISRAYYSIYYAAKALLLYHGEDPHTHKGVAILFHKFCATHKKPDKSFAKMLSIIQEERLNADYKEKTYITKEDAKEAIEMAKSFVKEITSLIT
jgi:uncharacterized protein (UPF0332 family)